jgi:hypothetical protein
MQENSKYEDIQLRVKKAHNQGSFEDVSLLIVELYKQNDQKSLDLCVELAMSEFGGITMKVEFQNIATLGVLHWGIYGLKKLGEATINTNRYRPINNTTRLLSYISSGQLPKFLFANFSLPSIKHLQIESSKFKTNEWKNAAKEILIDVVKSVEKEESFPASIMLNIGMGGTNENAQEHVFAALVARWFNFSNSGLQSFSNLVSSTEKKEIDYQNFLKNNPYILEPFHAQIWSKPKLGEYLIPDFVIRSMDNNYSVVEIEQADFPIMTKSGELSSKTVHAKRQALDFRDWCINNHLYAKERFPEIYRPSCLVIIGRESSLNDIQRHRLKQENESTQGILKIVGYDWLLERAKSTLENLVEYGFNRGTYRNIV